MPDYYEMKKAVDNAMRHYHGPKNVDIDWEGVAKQLAQAVELLVEQPNTISTYRMVTYAISRYERANDAKKTSSSAVRTF